MFCKSNDFFRIVYIIRILFNSLFNYSIFSVIYYYIYRQTDNIDTFSCYIRYHIITYFFFGWVVSVQRITNWLLAAMMERSEFGIFFVVMKNEFLEVYIIYYSMNNRYF